MYFSVARYSAASFVILTSRLAAEVTFSVFADASTVGWALYNRPFVRNGVWKKDPQPDGDFFHDA